MELIQSIDLSILLFIQEHLRFDWMTPFWKGITFLGNGGWFWIAAALVLLIPKKTRWAGVCGLLAMG
ncbi:MAG: phosphatase PAP2 family protein, partial [Oscillospiraceae bacterium]|nr:phosphatase PAP2 family protein [Oscillospiraceae bacterium]